MRRVAYHTVHGSVLLFCSTHHTKCTLLDRRTDRWQVNTLCE